MDEREIDEALLVRDERDLIEEALDDLERRDTDEQEGSAHDPHAPAANGRERIERVGFTGEVRHSRVRRGVRGVCVLTFGITGGAGCCQALAAGRGVLGAGGHPKKRPWSQFNLGSAYGECM